MVVDDRADGQEEVSGLDGQVGTVTTAISEPCTLITTAELIDPGLISIKPRESADEQSTTRRIADGGDEPHEWTLSERHTRGQRPPVLCRRSASLRSRDAPPGRPRTRPQDRHRGTDHGDASDSGSGGNTRSGA